MSRGGSETATTTLLFNVILSCAAEIQEIEENGSLILEISELCCFFL